MTRLPSIEWRLVIAPAIRDAWIRHSETLMRLAIALLAIYAALKLGDEFHRLIGYPVLDGAWDLELFHRLVVDWVAGKPIYAENTMAVYPPATMLLLFPLLGWMPVAQARQLWAAMIVAVLVWLVYLFVKHSGAETRAERTLIALFLLAMNATGATIGLGQLILPLLPFLIVGLFLLQQPVSWRRDLVAAGCMIVTLIKPNISVPFLWLVLFSTGGWRVLGLITFGYSTLTLLSASFQSTPLLILMRDWLARSSSIAMIGGYGNISTWAASLGLGEWALFGSFLMLIATGIWTWQHRHADYWLLLGVIAIAARLWTYHEFSDDMLILVPLIALFRIVKGGQSVQGDDVTAGLLLSATTLMMLLPTTMRFFPSPWDLPLTLGHPLVWIIVLVFLMVQAQRNVKDTLVVSISPNSAPG